ncbi:MAG: hypothetical protein DDG58_01295 [Ardenticatenia bacterium]|jgi:hypothetical protein|nr:MAG: hypothetical protein DDG58_01295 [Ardenticatenia bacterium]
MSHNLRFPIARIVLLLIGLSFLVTVLPTVPAHADPGIIRYAAPTPQGMNNCSSWANVCSLQAALTIATSGDEIWVKKGVHKPTLDPTKRTASFTLKDGVALYGGFAGTETSRDQRDWRANVTVLSGDIDNNDTTDVNGVVNNPYRHRWEQ